MSWGSRPHCVPGLPRGYRRAQSGAKERHQTDRCRHGSCWWTDGGTKSTRCAGLSPPAAEEAAFTEDVLTTPFFSRTSLQAEGTCGRRSTGGAGWALPEGEPQEDLYFSPDAAEAVVMAQMLTWIQLAEESLGRERLYGQNKLTT